MSPSPVQWLANAGAAVSIIADQPPGNGDDQTDGKPAVCWCELACEINLSLKIRHLPADRSRRPSLPIEVALTIPNRRYVRKPVARVDVVETILGSGS